MPLLHWDSATNGFLLDVRELPETAAEEGPEALNIVVGKLRPRLGELPRDREITATSTSTAALASASISQHPPVASALAAHCWRCTSWQSTTARQASPCARGLAWWEAVALLRGTRKLRGKPWEIQASIVPSPRVCPVSPTRGVPDTLIPRWSHGVIRLSSNVMPVMDFGL